MRHQKRSIWPIVEGKCEAFWYKFGLAQSTG